jgi:hypothetical protein
VTSEREHRWASFGCDSGGHAWRWVVEGRCSRLVAVLVLACAVCTGRMRAAEQVAPRYFEIHVVDAETGRGIPLVELETVDHVRQVTDNAGRIAYFEPGHAGQTIFFTIHAPGYHVPKDGFGFEGIRLVIEPGKSHAIPLKRVNLAERLYRCTGAGLYRDTVLLGHTSPLREPLGAGKVAGQDSVFALPYRGKLRWFWGDTLRLSYPLGHFRMAGAVSEMPEQGGLDPATGIDFNYFTGEDGFSRPMAELPAKEGVVWLDGFCTVPDAEGNETLVAHFSRRPGLADMYEQGLMRYNDGRDMFERVTTLSLDETWRFVRDHPVTIKESGQTWLVCGNPFPVTRVKATLADVLNPERYESWSCMDADADPESARPRRDAMGALDWRWQQGPPVTQQIEHRWLRSRLIKADEARFLPRDVSEPTRPVVMHSGTTRWNAHLNRWVMVAVEFTGDAKSPSSLGEVWYSEADSPQGPWQRGVKVVTHHKQTFYNPCHHDFFDQQGGRLIYFEGTYCNTFTASPPTQRYNYNQVMYRLDLDRTGLKQAFGR